MMMGECNSNTKDKSNDQKLCVGVVSLQRTHFLGLSWVTLFMGIYYTLWLVCYTAHRESFAYFTLG